MKLDAEGRGREDHPILFTKFATRDGVPIARAPITVAALLEVRAMAAEVTNRIALIGGLTPEDQLVERNRYPAELSELFYDHI